jgi:hypothetical protein
VASTGGRESDYQKLSCSAFLVGMTSQVSDVALASRSMPHLILVHGVLAFLFNIAVPALSTNVIASVFQRRLQASPRRANPAESPGKRPVVRKRPFR